MKTYYITTPIYYPNNNLHIGHAYTTVAADTMARYKKLRNYKVKFLTGTDEHGAKIEESAKAANTEPKAYVDKIVEGIIFLWDKLNIDYDIFWRTTDEVHVRKVQEIFETLYKQGDIYKGIYEDLYCTPCETFFTETQVTDNKCTDCGKELETLQEDAYFFRLSEYEGRLKEHIKNNPEFIMPKTRENEMVSNFLAPGLDDLCVSRTSFSWGVPVTFDPEHVVYVWVDALSNYVTALDDEEYKEFWPADLHLVGKEIVRFHSIIWPAILMALNMPLPKQIFGHGWLLMGGEKMAKRKGNVIDPVMLADRYGADAVRYFLMREIVFGNDGSFTNEALINRINSDLANDLGNLLSRTGAMVEKYFGTLPVEQESNPFDRDLIILANSTVISVSEHMDSLHFSEALNSIWIFVRRCNKYIDETTPWILAKDESQKPALANILYNLCESLRIISILISPVMPQTAQAIDSQINAGQSVNPTWENAVFGKLPRDLTVKQGIPLFPRIDKEKEFAELERLTNVL